jgi:hypothetical protein
MNPLAAAALIGRPPPPGKHLQIVQLDLALALFFTYGVKAESGEVEQALALDGGRSEVALPPGRLAC